MSVYSVWYTVYKVCIQCLRKMYLCIQTMHTVSDYNMYIQCVYTMSVYTGLESPLFCRYLDASTTQQQQLRFNTGRLLSALMTMKKTILLLKGTVQRDLFG
jgi:hypothetical protein